MFGNQVGVGVSFGQRTEGKTAPPGTVVNLMEVQTFGIQYADNEGRVLTTMVHRMAGVWYLAPNGENYAATLRPLGTGSKLAKALEERFVNATTTTTVPKSDAVDIEAGK